MKDETKLIIEAVAVLTFATLGVRVGKLICYDLESIGKLFNHIIGEDKK